MLQKAVTEVKAHEQREQAQHQILSVLKVDSCRC